MGKKIKPRKERMIRLDHAKEILRKSIEILDFIQDLDSLETSIKMIPKALNEAFTNSNDPRLARIAQTMDRFLFIVVDAEEGLQEGDNILFQYLDLLDNLIDQIKNQI